jgi:hypothetical protein
MYRAATCKGRPNSDIPFAEEGGTEKRTWGLDVNVAAVYITIRF